MPDDPLAKDLVLIERDQRAERARIEFLDQQRVARLVVAVSAVRRQAFSK